MSISDSLKKEWFVPILLVIPFVVSIYLWDQLPDQVPIHFNIQGEADDWGPKWINAFLIPGIALTIYIFLLIIPVIDPKRRIVSAQKPVSAIRIFTTLFMIGIYGFVMAKTLEIDVDLGIYINISVGVLILIIGNYMNTIKPNYFIGIRTPWTLENPEVWKKTHRIGSKLWVVGGLIMILNAVFIPVSYSQIIFYITVALIALVPIVLSYIYFKKLETND
tara:strand:- start:116574 stop:117233 length:660 start_codon:yes stop_codon:yes gene_type:complete